MKEELFRDTKYMRGYMISDIGYIGDVEYIEERIYKEILNEEGNHQI